MAIQNLAIADLAKCDEKELRPLLPCLARMTILKQLDNTKETIETRSQILSILVAIEEVNNIVALLGIDFYELEIDVRREQQLRYVKIKYSNQVIIIKFDENLHFTGKRLRMVIQIKIRHNFINFKMVSHWVLNGLILCRKFVSFYRNCFTFRHKFLNKIN